MAESMHTRVYALLIISPVIGHFVPVFVDLPIWSLTPRRGAIFVLFGFALYSFATQDRRLQITYSDIGILLVLSALISSILWSVDAGESLRRGVTIIQMWMYYVSLIIFFNREHAFTELLRVFLVAAVGVAGYGLLELLLTGELSRGLVNYISRNRISRNILAVLPIVAITSYLSTRWPRYLYGLIGSAMVVFIPLSGSRSGIVGLSVVIIGLSVVLLRYGVGLSIRTSVPVGIASFAVVTAAVLIAVRFGLVPARLTNIPLSPHTISPEVIGEKRYQVYLAEIKTIRAHWLTGIGYEGFVVLSENVYEIGSYRAHNLITRVWLAAGIGPVLVLVGTGVVVFRNYVQAISSTVAAERLYLSAFFVSLLGITVAGSANIVIDEPLWFILLAIGSNWVPRNIPS